MAWTTPRTWVAGELVTASMMNTHVRDNLNYLYGLAGTDYVRCTNGAQTISNTTTTALTFSTETFDVGGLHSTSSNTSRITIVNAGVYVFWGRVVINGSGSGAQRQFTIRKGGSTTYDQDIRDPQGGVAMSLNVYDLLSLSASDYVEVTFYQDSGGNLDTISAIFGAYKKS